jgi:Mrp family chromosome partitioning ATPase
MLDGKVKPKIEKNEVSSTSPGDFLPTSDMPDLFFPVETVFSPVSVESRVVVHTDPRSAGADRFRLVRLRLKNLQAARGLKTLLITSPLPGDGKSTVALNLATALSENGKHRVLLLEADVYRPTLIKKLDLKAWPGLTDCHRRGIDPRLEIRRIEPLGFYLLPAGQPTDDGSGLLLSGFTPQLIKELSSSSFSWILIDSPPSTPVADILALKAHADATLLVARAGHTPREAIEEAATNLGRDHIMGIILNGVEGLDRMYSKYYGYQSPEDPRKPEKAKGPLGLGFKPYGK